VKVEMMQREGDRVFIRYRDLQGQPQEILVDYVLAATGRRPNVDRLGLENTGLQLDARGVPLADRLTMQTSVPHIFIAGDASNQLPLLHEAS
ncbi:FAD-dependent oxidoreductase, partial [Klebsiella variicola]